MCANSELDFPANKATETMETCKHAKCINPRTAGHFFCYINSGGVQKLHPLYLWIGLEFFHAVFTIHQSVGNHKHILSDALSIKIV